MEENSATESDASARQTPGQNEFRAVVDELTAAQYDATVGQGSVTATVNGHGQLLNIEIDPYLADGKRSRLSSLLLQAITDARRTAAAEGNQLLDVRLGGRDALADKLASAAPWLTTGKDEEEGRG